MLLLSKQTLFSDLRIHRDNQEGLDYLYILLVLAIGSY